MQRFLALGALGFHQIRGGKMRVCGARAEGRGRRGVLPGPAWILLRKWGRQPE